LAFTNKGMLCNRARCKLYCKSNPAYVSLGVLFLLALLDTALSQSQPPCPKPQPYALLRQDED
jgi:hypothetical protein